MKESIEMAFKELMNTIVSNKILNEKRYISKLEIKKQKTKWQKKEI